MRLIDDSSTRGSERLSSRGELWENIEYGRAGAFSLRMDAHIPNGAGPFDSAIIVHGGGWVRGDRRLGVDRYSSRCRTVVSLITHLLTNLIWDPSEAVPGAPAWRTEPLFATNHQRL